MELQLSAAQHAWREEVRDFLGTELPDRFRKSTEWCEDEEFWTFAIAFTRKVSARGWIGLTWPAEYGGLARPPVDQLIFSEEFTYRDAPLVNAIGWGLAAGALLRGGTPPERAHAVHAGIAFILDFDVQLFTRRCRHWELDIGDERYHRERIAAALAA